MKIISLLLLLLATGVTHAQVLDVHDNGLIYDAATVGALREIVDSLNLAFRECPLDRTYLSDCQARGRYYRFDVTTNSPNGRERLAELFANMAVGAPPHVVTEECWDYLEDSTDEVDLVLIEERRWDHRMKRAIDGVAFFMPPYRTGRFGRELFVPEPGLFTNPPAAGRWVHTTSWDDHVMTVEALYITEEFASVALPTEYARLVQYADCLIDTAAPATFDPRNPESGDPYAAMMAAMTEMFESVQVVPRDTTLSDKENRRRAERIFAEGRRAHAPKLYALLRADERIVRGWPGLTVESLAAFEIEGALIDYIRTHVSADLALELMRRQRVEGSCSMDAAPIRHAQEIAVLAAESRRWDVFLGAHLDIMNDRFSRATDGSYAWEERHTHIRELEALEIDVHDLLLGISLSVRNASRHHYVGTIDRLGRAFAETRDPAAFERRIRTMIDDERLDRFNRFRLFCLYLNYLYELPDEKKSRRRIRAVRDDPAQWPEFLREMARGLDDGDSE